MNKTKRIFSAVTIILILFIVMYSTVSVVFATTSSAASSAAASSSASSGGASSSASSASAASSAASAASSGGSSAAASDGASAGSSTASSSATSAATSTSNPGTSACNSNIQCGNSGLNGGLFCQGNNVYQNYITYTCVNPGTSASYCSNSTTNQLVTTCSGNQTCSNGSCNGYNNNCTSNSYQRCSGNNLYWYDSCGNQQGAAQYCSNGCYNNSCQNYNYNYNYCTSNSYQRCNGNYLYWYDSCGNQQGAAQYCSNGCYNNTCSYNYNNNYYGNCTYHAYTLCQGNNIYWYDSCGNQQDFYYSCTNGQTCQYGKCVIYVAPIIPVYPVNNYTAHYRTACVGTSIYWYDSKGVNSGLYQNCQDTNSCTTDSCAANKCSNTLKCDGSTCATGSADYNTYCQTAQPVVNASTLSVTLFAKQDANSTQWQKTVQVGSNGTVYFMISVANNSNTQINNVIVSANIPTEITSLGNLQIDGIPVTGDIVSGINIGSIAPAIKKSITFEGKTQTISADSTKQATASGNLANDQKTAQSDSISVSLTSTQAAAAVSQAPAVSGFWGFIKRWYLWILAGLILIFLFVAVFRRFSSET